MSTDEIIALTNENGRAFSAFNQRKRNEADRFRSSFFISKLNGAANLLAILPDFIRMFILPL